jgi:ABC-type nitrate/sulfonate/bicarbonate transport system substrate-binding protein
MKSSGKVLRRGLVAALVAGTAGFMPVANSAQAADPVNVNIAHTKASVTGLLLNTVMEEGFDTANGWKANPTEVAAAPQILAGFVGGTLDLTSATIDNFISWQMSTPMTVWREQVSSPFWEIIVRQDFADSKGLKKGSSYKSTMQALSASNVGVVSKAGASEYMWLQLVGGSGVSYTGTVVPGLVNAATIKAAFTAKSVDAVIAYEPFATMMIKDGLAISPFSIRDGAAGMPAVSRAPGLSLGGPSKWFVANKALAKKIDKSFDQAAAWLKSPKNFAKAVTRLQERSGLDNATSIALLKQNLNYFSSNGNMNLAAWDRVGQWYKDTNQAITKGQLLQAKDFVANLSASDIKPVKVGSSLSIKSLATQLKLFPKATSKVTATSFSTKVCVVSSGIVKMKKSGTCEIGIQVVDKGAKNFQNRSGKTTITVKK